MVDFGVISQKNVDFLYFTDSVDDAVEYVTSYIARPKKEPVKVEESSDLKFFY